MIAVESGLDERRHDAAHAGLISTTIPLAVVLHPKPDGEKKHGLLNRKCRRCKQMNTSIVKGNKFNFSIINLFFDEIFPHLKAIDLISLLCRLNTEL